MADFSSKVESRIIHRAARMRSNRFVNILNRHRMALKLPGANRAAVKNKTGNIQEAPATSLPGIVLSQPIQARQKDSSPTSFNGNP